MHLWNTIYDPKVRGLHHRAARGFGHALLSPLVTRVFRILRVSAAIHEHEDNWVLLNGGPNFTGIEIEHGADKDRYSYNDQHLAAARRTRKLVRGERRGYRDLFAPIVAHKTIGTLVTGPFATQPPEPRALLEDWRSLTGRAGRLADPSFSSFLSMSLSVLVLEGDRGARFGELLECLARLMAGEGLADELANRAEALRANLEQARFAERSWEQVRGLLDEHFIRLSEMGRSNDLRDLGLSREPDQLLVGLIGASAKEQDPVVAAIHCNSFQRAAVDWARASGDSVTGQVADRGVVVLLGAVGSAAAKRRKVAALSEEFSRMALDRFGLVLHFGSSAITNAEPLGLSYQAALEAAETALRSGTRLLTASPSARSELVSLRNLRRELAAAADEAPEVQRARFERYLETVTARCHFRVGPARGHLEAGFERFAEPLVGRGGLDERSFHALCERLERTAEDARSIAELVGAYRAAVLDLCATAEKPIHAHRDRNLFGALDYVRKHYREPLSRKQIARIAGFAPAYFSVLFRKSEGTTFERYLLGLRIEYAKQRLEDKDWSAARIAELSGFKSPQYFSSAFHRETGYSPTDYRAKAKTGRASALSSNLITSRNDSKRKVVRASKR